jgi:hypothetical protein
LFASPIRIIQAMCCNVPLVMLFMLIAFHCQRGFIVFDIHIFLFVKHFDKLTCRYHLKAKIDFILNSLIHLLAQGSLI